MARFGFARQSAIDTRRTNFSSMADLPVVYRSKTFCWWAFLTLAIMFSLGTESRGTYSYSSSDSSTLRWCSLLLAATPFLDSSTTFAYDAFCSLLAGIGLPLGWLVSLLFFGGSSTISCFIVGVCYLTTLFDSLQTGGLLLGLTGSRLLWWST